MRELCISLLFCLMYSTFSTSKHFLNKVIVMVFNALVPFSGTSWSPELCSLHKSKTKGRQDNSAQKGLFIECIPPRAFG